MTSTPGGLSESVTNETAETGVAIDRSSFVPLYYQLALILWERLASGRLSPGDKLPSESELSTEFGISRSVIRPALTILESEGRIIRIKGRGCFIAQPKVPLAVRGLVPRLKISILDARTVRCTAETGRQLGLRAGQPVLHVVSSASSGGRPLLVGDSYIVPAAVPGAARLEAWKDVLSDVAAAGIRWGQPRAVVESGVCAQFEAEQLAVAPGSPTIVARVIERGSLPAATDEAPIELAWLAFRMDAVKLSFGR